ncbi:hypothetical protein C8R42DRAFT_648441 [Lentinula raphanica]|nr:hypothetical protein C8R42DRAFT_648441 [Lentinula raphanica]
MSLVVAPHAHSLTDINNTWPTPSPEEQEILDRLNIMSVDPFFRLLKEDDLVPTGMNPHSGEETVSLESTVSAVLWKALVDMAKSVFHASGTPLGGEIRQEYLQRVGMDMPPVLTSIIPFLTQNNPISYSIPRTQAEWNFYSAQNMLRVLSSWITICQYRCYKMAEAGMDPLWTWTRTLTEGIIPPPENFFFSTPPMSTATTTFYDPRLPTFDPRLIESIPSLDLVLHPTESHYAKHFPGFDAFTRNVLETPEECSGDSFCLGTLEGSLARMDIRED